MLRILDNFIVSGLKSIMEVGCVLLHSYMNELMSKRYENMMEFLINDMLRTDFFSKKNTEFVENFFNETKISKKLVKNIEEEFGKLLIKYPEILKCIPTLLAVRQYEILVFDNNGNRFEYNFYIYSKLINSD